MTNTLVQAVGVGSANFWSFTVAWTWGGSDDELTLIDATVCTQVLPPVLFLLGTHLTRVKLWVTRWRVYIVVDPLSMRTP